MKKKMSIVITALIIFGSLSQAAHLEAQDGGLWGQVDRYINDSDIEVPSSAVNDIGFTSVGANHSGSTEYSQAQGNMSGTVTSASYWGEDLGTALILNSSSYCYSSDEAAVVWAYGDIAAVVPAFTGGMFFTVMPDAGEVVGTPIRIHLHWYAAGGGIYGNAYAGVGSFGGNTIYVMRNVMPPVNAIPAVGVVWSREISEITGDYTEETGSFIALIGDTIGIFMDAHTTADLSGEGESAADVSTGMELLAGETVPQFIEYAYAPGLVYDPQQNITFLKDWSQFPDPMNWNNAEDTAENFVYFSGGVMYSNWRLPTTIDENGGTAGELGFLYTNYDISENYFGPFANLLGGDYWTGPTFSRYPDPDIAYTFTYNTIYGPAQYWQDLAYDNSYLTPVFDGPPAEFWCPADFNNDGIVDLEDFATFALYWLSERD